MEFLDEDARPKLHLQSRTISSSGSENQSINFRRPIVLISFTISSLLFAITFFLIKSEPYTSIAIWVALSILIGPLAPSSVTCGDIRVGVGKILDPIHLSDESDREDSKKRFPNRRSRVRKVDDLVIDSVPPVTNRLEKVIEKKSDNTKSTMNGGESEWTQSDFEILKKQLAKNPVGMPRRWEIISSAFLGRHSVESVVKIAKSMGEKKINDGDSFAKFLKDRKPDDKRVDEAAEDLEVEVENGDVNWSGGDDLALLNAMKAFPKEVSMRWEKIAAAVPGKTKGDCMKRITELKKGFRSSKNSNE
ncbi:transcription factor MAMYB [Impatiens glandulifera]|uniref:transcription factor MAMYB n=1 Tax=Impatiens glandulifera TaxID=253017 RepID=UPI001FB12333|nr:transcription factor MAMYB [Impatiens glandulifera]